MNIQEELKNFPTTIYQGSKRNSHRRLVDNAARTPTRHAFAKNKTGIYCSVGIEIHHFVVILHFHIKNSLVFG